MMHRLVTTIVLVLLATAALAEPLRFGVGLKFGDPAGFHSQVWYSKYSAIDCAVGWDLRQIKEHRNARIFLDHITTLGSGARFETSYTQWYAGIGGSISVADQEAPKGYLRIPIGIRHKFTGPFDIFLEFAPGLQVVPMTDAQFRTGLGMHFCLPVRNKEVEKRYPVE